jgi:hydroxypyruvate reductase
VAGGLAGEAAAVGARLGRWLAHEAPPGLHILGGETTVTLPAHPGRGGRNSHLALAAAREMEGVSGVALLAAGTDGRDGASEAAGARVDGTTAASLRRAGYEPGEALAAADSATAFAAIGQAVATGPTGTNVADLVLAWKGPLTAGPERG